MKRENIPVVVIGIVFLLCFAGIAVTAHLNARKSARRGICRNLLRQIDCAKDNFAFDHAGTNGMIFTWEEVVPYLKMPIKDVKCPSRGKYSINPLGQDPTCTIQDHSIDYRGDRIQAL